MCDALFTSWKYDRLNRSGGGGGGGGGSSSISLNDEVIMVASGGHELSFPTSIIYA